MSEKSLHKPLGWVRPEIAELSAYAVPDASGLIKLDAMENPYGWPADLKRAWQAVLAEVPLNRYPDAAANKLKQALRENMAIPAQAELLLGNGSDEIIQMLAMTIGGPGRALMAPEPGFAMYRMIARFCGMEYQPVPLGPGFDLDMPAMLAAIESTQPALLFIAQPNNPTGNVYSEADLRQLIEAAPGWVVVDEAYAPFTDSSCLPWLAQGSEIYPNLLVMRTVSKMGLAGLRLGLLAGPPALIAEVDKTRLPYNVGCLTQASAEFALAHADLFVEQAQQIRAERGRLYAALGQMAGIEVWPSEANFLLFKVAPGQAKAVHQGLINSGVLIKCLHGAHPQLADCLRVTIGKEEENTAFLDALNRVLAGQG
ncbi:MAG: histidinol-phosphate transaminase [Nevskiales bacterium]